MYALEVDRLPSLPTNIGSGVVVSLNRLVEILGELNRKEILVDYAEPREGDISHSLADIERLKTSFGLSPSVALKDGLQTLLDSVAN